MEDFNQNNVDLQKRDVKSKQLTFEQRCGVLEQLLQIKKNQKLECIAINKVAATFHINRLSVSRIWHTAQAQYREGKICANVSSKTKKKCGRKRKDYFENLAEIENIPINRRGTINSLSFNI